MRPKVPKTSRDSIDRFSTCFPLVDHTLAVRVKKDSTGIAQPHMLDFYMVISFLKWNVKKMGRAPDLC